MEIEMMKKMHVDSNYNSNVSLGLNYDNFATMDTDVRKTQEWLENEDRETFNKELLDQEEGDVLLTSKGPFN